MTLSNYFFLLNVFIKLLCTVKNTIVALSRHLIPTNIYLFKVKSMKYAQR